MFWNASLSHPNRNRIDNKKKYFSDQTNDFEVNEVREILHNTDGVVVQDNLDTFTYPMPLYAEGKNDVFVGRIRRDESQPNTLNMWIVADNLRKGAATNTIQIAEYLIQAGLV